VLCAPEELYPGLSVFEVMDGITRGNLRPPLDSVRNEEMAALMKRCWDQDPDVRPEFTEIVDILKRIPHEEL
jgi:hypothetical protein